MQHRFVPLIFAALLLAALSRALAADDPAPRFGRVVDVLVDGMPRRQYAHSGRLYVEALMGKEYAIRLRNPYGVRVAVALSVDGLNTIDARHTAAAAARKWILDPYQTVTIRGWQTSRTDARRFEFTTEARSYGQALGRTVNLGVITAVYFKERVPAVSARGSANEPARSRPVPESDVPAEAAPGAAQQRAGAAADDHYAATGMGRRTDHPVTEVRLDLEETSARTVTIRYEFRPQLVRLGILPRAEAAPLERRERARGFEPGFSPEPPRNR